VLLASADLAGFCDKAACLEVPVLAAFAGAALAFDAREACLEDPAALAGAAFAAAALAFTALAAGFALAAC
jgi:hypothetical protein